VHQVTPSGLIVESRSLIPGGGPVMPNDNDPASNPPGTVGTAAQVVPGDPDGVQVVALGTPTPWPRSVLRPSTWSGWPAEWETPLWGGRTADLTDTAWTCIDLNSRVVSIMPPYLVGAAPSLDADWMNNPDPNIYNSWIEFAKQLLWDYLLGEAFVLVLVRYNTGYPARFRVVAPWLVQVDMAGGVRRYTIGGADVTDDIIHIPYQIRTDEAHGHGPLEAGALRLVAARLLARYAFNVVAGGGLPTGTLTHPDELTAEQSAELQQQWVSARMASMGLPAVVSGGITFEANAYSPEQLTLLDLSRWNESRLAVLLGVPPFLVGLPSGGDSMTYSNVSQVFDYHWRAGLSTFATTCMAALSWHLLPRGTAVEVNRDEYVKADPLTRAQMWQIYNGLGLSWEQIAEAERFEVAAPSATLTSGVMQ
jgi:HK97 family phage portal protein